MHYYNFHIGDYQSHTHHLTVIEDIAFRRLLDHYYLHEAPIKQRTIARQIRMKDYEQEVLSVLDEFFRDTPDGYIHPRADEEIKKFREHQGISSFGSFIRDNPNLKHLVNKSRYIHYFNEGKLEEYLDTLRSHDGYMMGTSRVLDATNNQEPITNNHIYMDFEKVLKAKNKPLTQTLLNSIQKEADKAKISLEDAIKECCSRGWTTFKAEWIANKVDIVHQTVPSTFDRDPVLVKLDEEAKLLTSIPEDVKAKFKMLKGGK